MRRWLWTALCLAALAACKSENRNNNFLTGPIGQGDCDPLTSIVVTSTTGSTTIPVGGGLQLKATANSGTCTNPAVVWSSSNTSIATVNSTGFVIGVSVGTVTITAHDTTTGSNVQGSITITVTGTGGGSNPTVNPPYNVTLLFCANGVGSTTYMIPTNPPNALRDSILESTVDNQNVSVSPAGLVTPRHVGPSIVTLFLFAPPKTTIATIHFTVTADGCPTGPNPLIISPANPTITMVMVSGVCMATQQFNVTNGDATPAIAWTVTGNSINTSGLFTATQAGTFTVTATQGSRSGQTSVTVLNGCGSNPTVSPVGPISLSSGQNCTNTSVTLTASQAGTWAITSGSDKVTLSSVTSTQATVTTVANANGAADVTFTPSGGGQAVTVRINVSNTSCAGAASITVVPNPLNLHLGDIGTLTAQLVNITGTPTWTATLNCVSIVSTSGNTVNVQGVRLCRDSVVATIGTTKGFAIVNVTSSSNGCTINVAATMTVGQTANTTANCGASQPYWYSTDPSRVTVQGAPFVCTIDGVGYPCGTSATIKAVFQGSAQICVQPAVQDNTTAACQTVTVSPASSSNFIPNDGPIGIELKLPSKSSTP